MDVKTQLLLPALQIFPRQIVAYVGSFLAIVLRCIAEGVRQDCDGQDMAQRTQMS